MSDFQDIFNEQTINGSQANITNFDATNANITNLTSTELISDSGNISTLSCGVLSCNSFSCSNFSVTNAVVTNATISTATITSIDSKSATLNDFKATTGNITTLLCDAVTSNNLNCTFGSVPTLTSTIANISNLSSTTGIFSNASISTLISTNATISSATIATLNSTSGTIATLNSTTGTIATLNSSNATLATVSITGNLTFPNTTSQLFCGTNALTFPSASGTLVVNSQISGFVTTDTSQTITGQKTLTTELNIKRLSDVGNLGLLYQNSAGLGRWQIGPYGAETGSNSGSDFIIQSRNDDGTYLNNPFVIHRATHQIDMNGPVVSSCTDDATFTSSALTTNGGALVKKNLYLTSSLHQASENNNIYFCENSSNHYRRWKIAMSTENTGGYFYIMPRDDTGGGLDTAFYILRASGRVHIQKTVVISDRNWRWAKDFDINTTASVFYVTLNFTGSPWHCGGSVMIQSTTQNKYTESKTATYYISGAQSSGSGDVFVGYGNSSGSIYDLTALQKYTKTTSSWTLKFVSQNSVVTNNTAVFDLLVRGADLSSVSYS